MCVWDWPGLRSFESHGSVTKVHPSPCASVSRHLYTQTHTDDHVVRLAHKSNEAGHAHTRGASGTPLSPPQRPRGLPCSTKQDKSRLGQTGVSVTERERGTKGDEGEEGSCLPLIRFISLFSSLPFGWTDDNEKQGSNGREEEKSFKRVCLLQKGKRSCVCVCVF